MFATVETGFLGLPAHFLSDLVAVAAFGVLAIVLLAFGVKLADWIWKKLDLEDQVQKGNISAGIVMASVVLGLCYAMAQIVSSIIGG